MHRPLSALLLITVLVVTAACGARRMAPFAPHRPNTDFHRAAHTNQACVGCHAIATLGHGHQVDDDCLKCHRIVQGE